jgi:hypothetical protein
MNISRRNFFGMGIGAAAVAGLAPMTFTKEAHGSDLNSASHDPDDYQRSIDDAFTFQNTMMDAYATGDTIRLIQSYSDQSGLLSTAMTYDNAVSIHAYLQRRQNDDLARSQVLGNGLLYAQANNFPVADGRFAQGYFVNTPSSDGAYITPAATPFYFYTSAVGDQAWAGMALSQLYRRTGQKKYLTSALLVANWIVTNTYNTAGFGGYSFGTIINQYNVSEPSPNGQSTEHNIDTYAFFTMLDELTNRGKADNGSSWSSLAQHALSFVLAMYNSSGGYFYTGTTSTGGPINPTPIPEDCQTWSYLALLDNRYEKTIDWALANLQHEGFEFIAKFFENSMQELVSRNPGLDQTFRRIDANRFTAVVYQSGQKVCMGSASIGDGLMGRDSIAYSMDDNPRRGSMNESVSVNNDEQSLYFQALGMQSMGRRDKQKLTPQGAAEVFWDLFINPLQ